MTRFSISTGWIFRSIYIESECSKDNANQVKLYQRERLLKDRFSVSKKSKQPIQTKIKTSMHTSEQISTLYFPGARKQSSQDLAHRPNVQEGDAFYDSAQISGMACTGQFHRDRRPAPISLPTILHCFRTGYRLACERCRQRKQLLNMDDRQLKDIGITPEQAELEAGKPFWKV
jgi:uncharacterized protein YjiS (DUF1127 family)